jgi:hypothetical protein
MPKITPGTAMFRLMTFIATEIVVTLVIVNVTAEFLTVLQFCQFSIICKQTVGGFRLRLRHVGRNKNRIRSGYMIRNKCRSGYRSEYRINTKNKCRNGCRILL